MINSIYDQVRSISHHLRNTLHLGTAVITFIAAGGILKPYLLSHYVNYTLYPILTALMIVLFQSMIKSTVETIRGIGDDIYDLDSKAELKGIIEAAPFCKVLDFIHTIINVLILIAVLTYLPYLDIFLPSSGWVDQLEVSFGELFSLLTSTVPYYMYYVVMSLALALYIQCRQLKTWAKLIN
ncbi:hypothetical protein [Photobacterium leiognathi]|uniref:hypothetical protein n=1 Tax=Photobacterium leiognathi TaxID=553611 RepID=UPI0029815B9F|nr:hypothetical protein [Photobacterium leiognathi]